MSYAIDGQQYIGLAAGKVLYTFALPEENRRNETCHQPESSKEADL